MRLEPDPSDPPEAVDQDLGTAIARMFALADDPRTPGKTGEIWRELMQKAIGMRDELRSRMA